MKAVLITYYLRENINFLLLKQNIGLYVVLTLLGQG